MSESLGTPAPDPFGRVRKKLPEGTEACFKCDGTGKYIWGAITNGVPAKSGTCFGCKGKGYQTPEDVKRCENYWNHFARV